MSGFCVSSDKYVSIVIKIKYINSDNMSNIYDKLKFIINYTYLPQQTHILSKNTYILQLLTLVTRQSRNGTFEFLLC